MNSWRKKLIGKVIEFNPKIPLEKGTVTKKVPMACIGEFQRKINGYEIAKYTSGPKFMNNDVLLAKINPSLENGKAAKVDILQDGEVGFGSTEFIVLRETDLSDSNFIYYLTISPTFRKRAIGCMEGTSGRRRVNEYSLMFFELPFPEKDEQQRIGQILSDLDSKIELNNKINEELEALAKLIYDYWFVQFDFPDENGRPYKSSGGKMVFNQELKREIPSEWEVKSIGDIVDYNLWNKSKDSDFAEINYLDTSNLTKNKIDSIQSLNSKVDKIPSRAQRIVEKDDILYSTVRPNQLHHGIVKRPSTNLIASTGFAQIRSKEKGISNDLVYQFLSQDYVAMRLQQIAEVSVSSYPSISPNDIMNLKIALPANQDIINKSNITFGEMNKKIAINQEDNQKLTELRNWLLPMLMNGQVRVGEAKEKLGHVAEEGAVYNNDKEAIDALFETLNFDYEVATIQLLTERRFGFTYGKKYTHKMFSNIELLNTFPKPKELAFEEKGWGMFSKAIAKTIDNQRFVYQRRLDNGTKVLKVKNDSFKEVLEWITQKENKQFVEQVNAMLDLYEKPLIKKDMNRIELLNTVLECMKVLESDNLQTIRSKMAQWPMTEGGYKNKAEKFTENETLHMIGFLKEVMKK